MMKVEATAYGDRKVFSVSAFNRGIATWLQRLPTVWVEGEVTELKRHQRWQSVFFTLKDPADGSCLGVSMPRGQFDGLRLELADGDRVHAYGRPELYAARGEFRLRALSLERFGLGDHLAALERLKAKLAAARLFAPDLGELRERLDRARAGLGRGARRSLDVHSQRLAHAHERLRRAPALLVERRASALEQAAGRLRALSPKATLNRGYAIVRAGEAIVRSAAAVESGNPIDVEVSDGRFGARVD